ncbi:SusD/RagB family nutrient-binding outer membrane lipoprotein [Pedobacter sp. KBW06]|uniref:SusD/RagB family nutrient-binding outer membrane lipoprotein n=1 Tax=Pedobacter sp. KBW06 TaxID=2153359 RepID=UPI000F59E0D8|nr:SusD/RagB family nutrient-binding outer membrane lipoprotein [Pedobacter sp. KBW06]RQO75226.1 SusD/RagB family nutrient-binding outer membrane lipoprotein [Pedobacter sp. KBW06]
MKKLIYSLLAGVLLISSCKDQDFMNIDPNKPTQAHPQLLLTKVEWNAFRAFGGTSPLYANRMLVQTDGESEGQYFKWGRGDFSPYANLRDVTKMVEEAKRINDNSYVALAKFFRAYYFYNLTLTFGDIPYSQALMGESGQDYAPVYDTQKMVFAGILRELDEANTMLKGVNGSIAGDIIYKGDAAKWRRLINAFRLKVLITLSKKENDTDLKVKEAFTQVMQNELLLGTEAGGDGQLVFLDQEGNRYPEFNSSGFGSGMFMSATFIEQLQARKDPRLFLYCTQTKIAKEAGKAIDDFSSYEGGDPAAPYAETSIKAAAGKVSKVNDRFPSDPVNEPLVLMGYAEQELIIAEAIVRNWISGDANLHYKNGVKASFKFYQNYVKGYTAFFTEEKANEYLALPINDLALSATTEQKIEQIVNQKYLRTFFQSGWSAFYDQLRTGYPEFRRPQGVAVPFRWIYPQTEYDNNRANVSKAIENQFGAGNDKINQQVWWVK